MLILRLLKLVKWHRRVYRKKIIKKNLLIHFHLAVMKRIVIMKISNNNKMVKNLLTHFLQVVMLKIVIMINNKVNKINKTKINNTHFYLMLMKINKTKINRIHFCPMLMKINKTKINHIHFYLKMKTYLYKTTIKCNRKKQ